MGVAGAAGVYVVITLLLFRNLLPRLQTHLFSDIGDPLLNVAILAWNARVTPLTAAWWDFPAFAPLSGVTSFTEHLLAVYPIATPIIWATDNPVLAHNLLMLATLPLNGVAAYLLAKEITGSATAAFVGGLAFAFAPYHAVQLSHLQTLTAWGLPVALLGLHRYSRTGSWGALATFAAGWLATGLANAYMLVFFPIVVAGLAFWLMRRRWARIAAIAGAGLFVVALLAPLLWGYQMRQRAYGLTREVNEIRSFSADVRGIAGISHRSTLWRGVLPHTYEEGSLFPGLAIAGLALFAVWRRPTDDEVAASIWTKRLAIAAAALGFVAAARIWLGTFGWHIGPIPLPPVRPVHLLTATALAAAGAFVSMRATRAAFRAGEPATIYAGLVFLLWVLALGPTPSWEGMRVLAPAPYAWLMQLPGVTSIRVPARAWLPAVLCLAAAAAAGWSRIRFARPRAAYVALAALTCAIVAEGWFRDGVQAVPKPLRNGTVPSGALVLDLPISEGFQNTVAQYSAVVNGYRTINGYSGYQPPFVPELRRAIADLNTDALDGFRRLDDLYVVIRPGTGPLHAQWIASQRGAERLFRTPESDTYRLPRLTPGRTALPLALPPTPAQTWSPLR